MQAMTPRVIKANRGHSAWRQQLAPQPDSGAAGMRPMDHMARNSPRSRGGPNFPVAAPFRQNGGGQQRQWRDSLNPNGDNPVNLSPIQRAWIQRNLGVNSSRGLSRYIRQAGGLDPFQQMLNGMPGWGRASAGIGPRQGQGQPGMGQGGQGQGPPPQNGVINGSVQGPPQFIGQPMQPTPMHTPEVPPTPARSGAMFPEQAARYAPEGNSQPGVEPGGPIQGPGQASSSPRARQQTAAPAPPQTPQEHGLQLATEPRYLATTMAYRGATDREAQKKQDRERFANHGLPLSPEVEEGMRELTDMYIEALIEHGYSEADAAAYVNIQKERLAQNFAVEQGRTDEEAAERGVLGSGVHQQMQSDLSTDYGREFEDLAMQAAQTQRGLSNQEAALLEALRQGRIDLSFLQAAQAFETGATTPFSGMRTGGRGKPRSRRRSERERNG